jgi:ABC-type lipoprotein release transport system permease subunit
MNRAALREFTVVGIFEVGLQEHDSVLALINLQDAEALRGLSGPTGIRSRFDDVLQAPELARARPQRLHPALAGARLDAGQRSLFSRHSHRENHDGLI